MKLTLSSILGEHLAISPKYPRRLQLAIRLLSWGLLTLPRTHAAGGEVVFDNAGGGTINAPIYGVDGLTPLEGTGFRATLYAGPEWNSLQPVGASMIFRTGAASGFLDRSSDPSLGLRVIDTVNPGDLAYVQVRVWDAADGSPSYEDALAAGGAIGSSVILSVYTGGQLSPMLPPLMPGTLQGLQSFKLVYPASALPEPVSDVRAVALSSHQVEISWIDHADNEDGFEVHRWDAAGGTWSRVGVAPAQANSWLDSGLAPSAQYYYRVATFNYAGLSEYSAVADAFTLAGDPPATPFGVQATDGLYPDRVEITWDPVPAAAGYHVWRGPANDFPTASKISPVDVVAPPFADTTAEPGVTSWYWVTAVNSHGTSGASLPDPGMRATPVPAPPPPTAVTASDGSLDHAVLVSWIPVEGATHYEVWRSTTENPSVRISYPDLTESSYLDETAMAGNSYWYWVRTVSPAGTSGFSEPNSGYGGGFTMGTVVAANRYVDELDEPMFDVDGITLLEGPAFVAGVYAGPNTNTLMAVGAPITFRSGEGAGYFTGGIRYVPNVPAGSLAHLQVRIWDTGAGASYEEARASGGKIGASPVFIIRTGNLGNPPSFPAPLTGLKSFSLSVPIEPAPPAPAWVLASDGAFLDAASVTWEAVPTATAYQVWRSLSDSPSQSSLLADSVTITQFLDISADPGRYHFYWIKALNDGGTSGFSAPDRGHRALSPPSLIQVSQGSIATHIELGWTSVPGAVTYRIWRHVTPDPIQALNLSSSADHLNFVDDTALPGILYYYWVQSQGPDFLSPLSAATSGYRGLESTLNLRASDGTHPDEVQVRWNPAPGATSYELWRNTTSDPISANLISNPGLTTTSFTDVTAAPGVVYHYWVRAANSLTTSAPGLPDLGHAALRTPGSLAASDGLLGRVELTWDSVPAATHYEIWRCLNDDPASASLVSPPALAANSFTDTTPFPGVRYYYWIRAVNSLTSSLLGSPETGFAALTAPTNITASDGLLDHVAITWNPVTNADYYELWRSTSPDLASAMLILPANPTTTTYTDTTAVPGLQYHYWLRASNGLTTSSFSNPDTGYVTLPAPPSVAASDGLFLDRIRIDWSPVLHATTYQVWRADTANLSLSTMIATGDASPLVHVDQSAAPGVTYTYWVRALGGVATSSFSTGDTGFLDISPVTALQAADGDGSPHVALSWQPVAGATGHRIWRGSTPDANAAIDLTVSGSEPHFEDHSAQPGVVYYYWVQTVAGLAESSLSTPDSGYLFGIRVVSRSAASMTLTWPGTSRLETANQIGDQFRPDPSIANPITVPLGPQAAKYFRLVR